MELPTPALATDTLLDQSRRLAGKLDEHRAALRALEASIEAQMAAMRTRESAEVRETTLSANDRLHALTRLYEEQEALMAGIAASLGWEDDRPSIVKLAAHLEQVRGGEETARALLETRTAITELAAVTREKSEELAYTLQYALHLGKELIQAVQAVHQPVPISLYTPRGKTTIGGKTRPIVNRMG
ncbi:MAG: flagellar export chaperone FlgN [Rhodothermales bacterium]|nr:flagellar export chaperone FlgN [Rhodothermales bacterium]